MIEEVKLYLLGWESHRFRVLGGRISTWHLAREHLRPQEVGVGKEGCNQCSFCPLDPTLQARAVPLDTRSRRGLGRTGISYCLCFH